MNRAELARLVARRTGHPIYIVEKVLAESDEIVSMALATGEDVMLTGFGKFVPRHVPERKRHDLNTGTLVEVPEATTAVFYPSPKLKQRLNP